MKTRRPAATKSVDVTPGDGEQPTMVELYVGVGGDIVGRLLNDDTDHVWRNVPSGFRFPYAFRYIRAASTASEMIAVVEIAERYKNDG